MNPLEPTHDHRVAELECALSVTRPVHVAPLFVAPVDVGIAFTASATVVRLLPVHPGALADKVYTPASAIVTDVIVAFVVVLLLIVLTPPLHKSE